MVAYQKAVSDERGKLTTDHNTIRQQILAELKTKPVATAAPIAATKPNPTPHYTGKRDLEDVIKEAMEGMAQ